MNSSLSPTLPIATALPRNAPRVLVPACNRFYGEHPFHMVGRKYIEAVRLAGAYPIVVPAAHPDELEGWLDLADGVLLTGSASNVHPSHFSAQVHDETQPLDPLRDAWTLPLIRLALARGLPLLGICRGFQEANVALGGSLHQAVHEQAHLNDHRADDDAPVGVQYGPSHPVHLEQGGLLASLFSNDELVVNSIHGQGIDRLADGLRVEARAPDGLVEAFSPQAGPGFALCLQWHPEWQAADSAASLAILKAFGAACQDWRDLHRPPDR
jgi:putative glutamine amidotransferase